VLRLATIYWGTDQQPHRIIKTTATEKSMTTRNRYLPNSALNIIASVCFSVSLLSACTQVDTGPARSATATAEQLSAAGKHVEAGSEFLRLAREADDAQRQRYLIFAANELYLANDLAGAERILSQTGPQITPRNIAVWAEITALLKLAQDDPQTALDALNQVSSTDNKNTATRILLLRADALFRLGRPPAAVGTLVKREELLDQPSDINANHRVIWTGLQSSGHALTADTANTGNPVTDGWLELGFLAYNNRISLSALSAELERWRSEHPEHPASGQLLDDVLANLSTLSNYPDSVAVLLPLTGKQKTLGQAIRDGYLAAHFTLSSDDNRPQLAFYDTATAGGLAAYEQAMAAGAEFVVGPLLKKDIEQLISPEPEVNVLALNFLPDDTDTPSGFFQFALSPEDEARAAADRAADEGLLNAVALIPDNTWGERVINAFRKQLEKRGGQLLAAQAYPANVSDYSDPIRRILLLDESQARHDRLTANINRQLEFEPRRRHDVDLIFIGANAAIAKLINPQLNFHYAGDLPVFATSAVHQPGSADNPDLNGIMFPDIPWLLNPNQSVSANQAVLERYWGSGTTQLSRFYALGYDAYYLTAMLNSGGRKRGLVAEGVTGLLEMDRDGQLHRKLLWAQIVKGQPRILPDTNPGLSAGAEIFNQTTNGLEPVIQEEGPALEPQAPDSNR